MGKIILKDYLKTLIIQHRLILAIMNCLLRLKNGHRFQKQIVLRYKTDILDYEVIAQPLPYYPIEPIIENNYYGLGKTLSEYVGLAGHTDTYIEHGVFFGPNVVPNEREWRSKKIIVPSTVRVQHLKNKGVEKECVIVGPYIHYAKPLLTPEAFIEMKSYLGKVLLVFPSHSIVNVTAEYDIDHFISFIESIRSEYDTILISLYWLDALNNDIVRKYKAHNFKIVTAGNRFDPYFLNRQKSIISLADDTLSNDVGTHVGYCVYLGKSHYIFAQDVSYAAKNVMEEIRLKRSYNKEGEDSIICENEINEVKSAFSVFTPGEISDLQKQVVDKYWGVSEIKTSQVLKKFIF